MLFGISKANEVNPKFYYSVFKCSLDSNAAFSDQQKKFSTSFYYLYKSFEGSNWDKAKMPGVIKSYYKKKKTTFLKNDLTELPILFIMKIQIFIAAAVFLLLIFCQNARG